jgi:hypothetical protein
VTPVEWKPVVGVAVAVVAMSTKGLERMPGIVSVFISKILLLFYGSIIGIILFAMFKLLL